MELVEEHVKLTRDIVSGNINLQNMKRRKFMNGFKAVIKMQMINLLKMREKDFCRWQKIKDLISGII